MKRRHLTTGLILLSACADVGAPAAVPDAQLRTGAFDLESAQFDAVLDADSEGPLLLSTAGLAPQTEVVLLIESNQESPLVWATHGEVGEVYAEDYAYVTDLDGEVRRYARLVLDATVDGPYEIDAELEEPLNIFSCDEWVESFADDGSPETLRSAVQRVRTNGRVCFDPAVFDGSSSDVVVLQDQIEIFRPLDVWGTGIDTSVVSGGGSTRIFEITAATQIRDMTLQDGHAAEGGLVWAQGDPVELRRLRMRRGTAGLGGAAYFGLGIHVLESAIITDSSADWGGGVLGSVYAKDSLFARNTATVGGGAWSSTSTFEDCEFADNSAEEADNSAEEGEETPRPAYGGGLFSQANTYVLGSQFSNNVARTSTGSGAGGAIAARGLTLHIDDSPKGPTQIVGNDADQGGGVASLVPGSGLAFPWGMFGSTLIDSNTATRGGCLYVVDSLDIKGQARCVGNTATQDGGGAYVASEASIEAFAPVGFEGNEAGQHGGGVYLEEDAAFHAIHPGVSIRENTASTKVLGGRGGGVYDASGTSPNLVLHSHDNAPDDYYAP